MVAPILSGKTQNWGKQIIDLNGEKKHRFWLLLIENTVTIHLSKYFYRFFVSKEH